jgi:dsDNA-specific endonuclease/ATPase MutS2
MTQEDADLWKRVTEGSSPLLPKPSAPVIRPDAPPVRRQRARFTTLDLHGLTLQQAHSEVLTLIREAKHAGLKYVTVITGLSGQIRREFTYWVEHRPEVRKIDCLNGGGAFKIFLKKTQHPK